MYYVDEYTSFAIKKYPHRAKDIIQSFDKKQVACKKWLVEKLIECDLGRIEKINVLGSWYGQILVPMLDSFIDYKSIDLYDVDDETCRISRIFFPYAHYKNLRVINKDVTELEIEGKRKLTINTSCEHMQPLNIKRSMVALQSNNYTEVEDHTNCVESVDELISQYDFRKVFYSGEMEFEKYTRFMVIGEVK